MQSINFLGSSPIPGNVKGQRLSTMLFNKAFGPRIEDEGQPTLKETSPVLT